MSQVFRRPRLRALIFSFIVIYSILVTWKVHHNVTVSPKNCQNIPQTVYIEKENPPQDISVVIEGASKYPFDLRGGRWDNQILYKMFDQIIVGDIFYDLTESRKVCLATQSSIEKLSSLVEVSKQWNGPISVALYTAGNEELSITFVYVSYLRECFADIRRKATFHFALPKDRMPTTVEFNTDEFTTMDCNRKDDVLKQLLVKRSEATTRWREKNPYPQNHMRNLARKNCGSLYVFLTDIDIIPSAKMAEGLEEFFQTDSCVKCAYVIPTYEVDNRVPFPQNKSEVVRLARKKLARPFHQKVFIYNQYATNFSRWEQDVKEGPVQVSHPVTNFEMFYEPFYVAKDNVPPHDERFIGYGFTRNTQVYEMFVAGYEFRVLTPVFAIHWGLQERKGRPFWREKQNNRNNQRFQIFKKELFARYQNDPLQLVNKDNRPQLKSLKERLL